MSVAAEGLTTRKAVQDEIGTSSNGAMIDRMIEEASAQFRSQTNRGNIKERTGFVERVAGYGGKRLVVTKLLPLTNINSITYDNYSSSSTVNASDYTIEGVGDSERGFILKTSGMWRDTREMSQGIEREPTGRALKYYKVDYDGGWNTPAQSGTTTLPQDIQRAVIEAVKTVYQARKRPKDVKREAIGAASTTFADTESMPGAWQHAVYEYELPALSI